MHCRTVLRRRLDEIPSRHPCRFVVVEHLVPLRTIPPIHNDPFDRIMVCQSMVEKIPLISYDKNVNAYFK